MTGLQHNMRHGARARGRRFVVTGSCFHFVFFPFFLIFCHHTAAAGGDSAGALGCAALIALTDTARILPGHRPDTGRVYRGHRGYLPRLAALGIAAVSRCKPFKCKDEMAAGDAVCRS